MNTRRPLVSVILPTRNRMDSLARAVESVLRQSEHDFELIVVNDASVDRTGAYLKALATQDSRVRVVCNPVSKGGAGARNEGISYSGGKWIAFLDDDDEWMPTKLQRQLDTLKANESAVACSCSYVQRFPSGWSKVVVVRPNMTLQQLLLDNCSGGASMCVCSSDVLREIGGFDAKFRSGQDHDLWVRLCQKGDVVACGEALVLYQAHGEARITNDMQAQYLGARRFYWKHRHLMDTSLRRRRIARSCFIMSRQVTRGLRHRIRYLILSLRNSSLRVSLTYARSSVPRLLRDALFVRLAQRSSSTHD